MRIPPQHSVPRLHVAREFWERRDLSSGLGRLPADRDDGGAQVCVRSARAVLSRNSRHTFPTAPKGRLFRLSFVLCPHVLITTTMRDDRVHPGPCAQGRREQNR